MEAPFFNCYVKVSWMNSYIKTATITKAVSLTHNAAIENIKLFEQILQ